MGTGPLSATLAVLRSRGPLALTACRCGALTLALCSLGDTGSSFPVSGMSHEPKSPSIGMLSTATRTTATVNPLTPSPLNGALVPTGSPATSSALSAQAAPSSSFAAALRKLAKQAEEPRGKRTRPLARGMPRCPPLHLSDWHGHGRQLSATCGAPHLPSLTTSRQSWPGCSRHHTSDPDR